MCSSSNRIAKRGLQGILCVLVLEEKLEGLVRSVCMACTLSFQGTLEHELIRPPFHPLFFTNSAKADFSP